MRLRRRLQRNFATNFLAQVKRAAQLGRIRKVQLAGGAGATAFLQEYFRRDGYAIRGKELLQKIHIIKSATMGQVDEKRGQPKPRQLLHGCESFTYDQDQNKRGGEGGVQKVKKKLEKREYCFFQRMVI